MTATRTHKGRHARPDWPPRWVIFAAIFLIGVGVAFMIVQNERRAREAATANANAQTLAEEVEQACADGDVPLDNGSSLCERARDVKEQAQDSNENLPGAAAPGPVGPQGPAGRAGDQGAQGDSGPAGESGDAGPRGVPGPAGVPGADGESGPDGAPGAAGADGANGNDGAAGSAGADGAPGEQGPQGPQGEKGDRGEPGPAGADGEDGTDGRGIASVQCTADGWVITYTDGESQNAGPCRTADDVPEPEPTP